MDSLVVVDVREIRMPLVLQAIWTSAVLLGVLVQIPILFCEHTGAMPAKIIAVSSTIFLMVMVYDDQNAKL
jgi:hypothetical protein